MTLPALEQICDDDTDKVLKRAIEVHTYSIHVRCLQRGLSHT